MRCPTWINSRQGNDWSAPRRATAGSAAGVGSSSTSAAPAANRTQYPQRRHRPRVLWRLRYKLSLRDLAEMFLIRGFVFSYEAVRHWEAKLTPALADELRRRRKGKVGPSLYVDETYIRVHGRWKYLYRAIDRDGALVDVHAERAPRSRRGQGLLPIGKGGHRHNAGPGHHRRPRRISRAIRTELGKRVRHRTNQY